MIRRYGENGWSLFGPHRRRSLEQARAAIQAACEARALSAELSLRVTRDEMLGIWRSVRGLRHGVNERRRERRAANGNP